MTEEKKTDKQDSLQVRYMQLLLGSFRRYYDIHEKEDLPEEEQIMPGESFPEGPEDYFAARCDFQVHNAQYILSKNHELWGAESREHCYIFSVGHLSQTMYKSLEKKVYETGMKLIHPEKGHMCTTLTLMIVCGSADPEAVRLLKKCRIHKDFRFTLDGWMDFHTAVIQLDSGRAATNFSGHDNRKLLSGLYRGMTRTKSI